MISAPDRPQPGWTRAHQLGRVLVAAVLVATIVGCNSKTPAQLAAQELTAGLAAATAGNADQAVAHYQACLKQEPSNKYCLYNLGANSGRAGRAAEAENYYRVAVAQDPNFPSAVFNLALLLGNAGAYREAIGLFRHYVELQPDDPDGHLYLGLVLRNTGDAAGAETELNLAVKLNPKVVIPSPTPTASAAASPSAAPSATTSQKPGASPSARP
jgi:tetratricopeptide (TPR) repeat protein